MAIPNYRIRIGAPVIQGFSEEIGALRDSLEKRKQREEYARQNSLAEKRLAMQEERARVLEEERRGKANEQQALEIYDDAASGRLDRAAVRARAGSYMDPRTGQRQEIGFDAGDPGGERFDPQFEPLKLPSPAEQHPEADAYKNAGKMFALKNPQEEMAASGYANAAAAMNPAIAAKKQVAARPTSMVMPSGERVNFDPAEGDRFKREKAAERADLLEASAAQDPDPRSAQAKLQAAQRIRSQIDGAEGAHLRNVELQESKQDFTAKQADKFQLTAEAQIQQKAADRAARKKRGAGGQRSDAKNKDDDLDILDRNGNVVAVARTPQAAEALRTKRTTLAKTEAVATKLKEHLTTVGNINPVWGALTGKSGEQAPRDAMIAAMIEARKEITGATNEADEIRIKKQMDTAWRRGPEYAVKAVDVFMDNLRSSYDEGATSAASRLKEGNKAISFGKPAAPVATPAAAAKPAPSPDRARYEAAITKAKAAGNLELVKRLQAEMGGM